MMAANNIFFLIRFFGRVTLLFLIGWAIGHVIKIDDFFKN